MERLRFALSIQGNSSLPENRALEQLESQLRGDVETALKQLQQPYGVEVAEPLRNLAIVLASEGKNIQSEALFKEALSSYEVISGANSENVARTLDGYAALLRRGNRGAEAEQMASRAAKIRTLLREKAKPSVGSSIGPRG